MATKEGDVQVIREGLTFKRYFTHEGVHPFDEIEWELRDAVIPNYKEGGNAFEQRGVEFPTTWSQNATNIVAQKYFRGTLGTPERESSVRQLVGRVVDTVAGWGRTGGYFATEQDAQVFSEELAHLLVTQKASFNSPVWFNLGVPGMAAQASACFILAVDDHMSSILNWYVEEGTIFKGGSGSGINLSTLRSSKERVNGGGTASGPVSFMRGADASAGTIKSGGKTRRAAKMVILNADHPDIRDFVWCKALEEHKARALRDAGFDMDLDGRDSYSIQYQNANNSVRVTDEFMKAYEQDQDWKLKTVLTDETVETIRARDLMRDVAQAAWECADPGMQYDTTINEWHTCPASGRINASNPCSEYMHLDNSACNLASLNLMKFLDDDGNFDVKSFRKAVEIVLTAQEIVVGPADYPTEKIGLNARAYRQLGLGYANLGALLMARGLPYDSDAGRAWAGAITALMTGQAYRTSARIAEAMGPFEGYEPNADAMLRVMRKHRAAADEIDGDHVPEALLSAAKQSWDDAIAFGAKHGYRNSQATVLAPTGSGRLTATLVMAGAIAAKLLKSTLGIQTEAYTTEIGGIRARNMTKEKIAARYDNEVRCPDLEAAQSMKEAILEARKSGDSLGGIIECISSGLPVGMGEPIFASLESDLSKALFSIPAVKAVEFGSGFAGSKMRGSDNNDSYLIKENKVVTKTNNAGGILGGLSNGMPIVIRVGFKPAASVAKTQQTLDISTNEQTNLTVPGRHDPCVVPRAPPVVECVVSMVLADHAIRSGLIPLVLK